MGVANLRSCHQEIWQHGLIMVGGQSHSVTLLGQCSRRASRALTSGALSVVSLPDEVFCVVDQRFGKTCARPATRPVRGET